MRIGIIDLGTNSVRFDVHQIGPGRRVKLLHREKIMVRLGQGVFTHGKLERAALNRTLQAFTKFKRAATQLRAGKIVAFGTSALREVADRDRLLDGVQRRTGIEVRVISGTEEAKLIALGILTNESCPKGRFALVDIGGGSTEISICRGKQVLRTASFPLGTARLQQMYLRKSPPNPLALEELRARVRAVILERMRAESWPQVDRVIGSSGTIRAVAKMLSKKPGKGAAFDRAKVGGLVTRMAGMTIPELLLLPRMEPKRADMIVGGAALFEELLKCLGAKKASATEYSLRDGILREELALYRQGAGTSHLALHLDELYDKAGAFGQDRRHLERTVAVGQSIFTRLKALHKLDSRWSIYLTAAIILRKTGEAVSRLGSPAHSGYVVRHADLPPMEDWEIELVASLCERYAGSKLEPKGLPFKKGDPRRLVFTRLLALLQIIDALDSGKDSSLVLKSVQRRRKGVVIRITGRGVSGLETVAVEQRRQLFEKTFRARVSVERV